MVILKAISLLGMNGSLQAARAMTPVAGMTFMAVDHGHCQASQSGQRLVAFQACVEVVQAGSQGFHLQQTVDPPDRVTTRQRLPQPAVPEPRLPHRLQRRQTSQPSPEHRQGGFHYHAGGNPRQTTLIRHLRHQVARKTIQCLTVSDQSSENGLIPFVAPAPVATPVGKAPPAAAASPGSRSRLGGRGLPNPWECKPGEAAPAGSAPNIRRYEVRRRCSGRWACRTCDCALTGSRATTSAAGSTASTEIETAVRKLRGWSDA